ncbi:MAG: type II secretion system F family protein [Phycisphaerales bacterium JB065]
MSTRFAYTAVPLERSGGAFVRGVRDAVDERELRDALRDQGLLAVSVRPVRLIDALRSRSVARPVRGADRMWFFETLSYMVGSKVPIETAMREMAGAAPRARLGTICNELRDRLRRGESLSAGIAELSGPDGSARGLADEHHLAILRSGERSGQLDHASELVRRSIAEGQRVKAIVVGRLIYPLILILATVVVLWILSSFVVPRFETTLVALGGELPWQTRFTLGASRAMIWVVPVVVVLVGLVIAGRDRLVPEGRRRVWSRRVLRVPVVGTLVWHHQAGVVCDVVASMLEGGADVLEALDQSADVVRSREVRRRMEEARSRVREGADLGEALRGEGDGQRGESEMGVLPPMVGAVVSVGVRTGELVRSLRRASELCVKRQERTTQTLLTLMEPAIILVLSASVGWVVYSLVVGMLAMTDVASG